MSINDTIDLGYTGEHISESLQMIREYLDDVKEVKQGKPGDEWECVGHYQEHMGYILDEIVRKLANLKEK